jgi:hypothetical protein
MENQQSASLRIQGTVLLISLIVQYALGMYVNLFVAFPDGIQGGGAWEFSWRQPALATHIVLGILLLIGSIVFLIRVLVSKSATWKYPAIGGLVGILLAGFAGATFIPSQTDAYSYIMSLAFLIAFGAYARGLFSARSAA